MKDYYSLLGVRKFAGAAEIKRAYRQLALKYHPDKNPDPSAEALFKEINEAYDLLSDPNKKSTYDHLISTPVESSSPVKQYSAHRDPRYRGTGRHRAPVISNRERILQLVRHYHPKMLWIPRASIVFACLFFLDYVLPYKTVHEVIAYSRIISAHNGKTDYFMEFASSRRLKVYGAELAAAEGSAITVTYSWLFETPMSLEDGFGTTVELGYMYSTLLFLPLLLLIVSVLAVVCRQHVDFSFNLIVLNGMLLLINFTFL